MHIFAWVKKYISRPQSLIIILALALCTTLGLVWLFTPKSKISPIDPDATPSTLAPLGYTQANENAIVKLTFPQSFKTFPLLHKRLYNEGEAALKAFMVESKKDRQDMIKDGVTPPVFEYNISWSFAAETQNLVSVFSQDYAFTGGAHPNHYYQTILWDKSKSEAISTATLFNSKADFQAVDAYVCHDIEAQRSKRAGEPIFQVASGMQCPKLIESRLVLVPSNLIGKAATVEVIFSPYEVASYAEGDFQVRIPSDLLTPLLHETYGAQFGGISALTPQNLSAQVPSSDVAQ